MFTRRTFVATFAALAATAPLVASAQAGYPAKPIKEKPAEQRAKRRPATPDPLGGEDGGSGGRLAP